MLKNQLNNNMEEIFSTAFNYKSKSHPLHLIFSSMHFLKRDSSNSPEGCANTIFIQLSLGLSLGKYAR